MFVQFPKGWKESLAYLLSEKFFKDLYADYLIVRHNITICKRCGNLSQKWEGPICEKCRDIEFGRNSDE